MRTGQHGQFKKVTICPGEYYVSNERLIISTLLGSCVAACLYDPVHHIIGMNHFLLANQRYARDMPVITSDAGRYGIHSMEILINAMLKKGANRHWLKAKAFGGSNIFAESIMNHDNFESVGEVNTRFIKSFLEKEKIPLVASDLGGTTARVVNFVGSDFSVYQRRVESHASHQILDEEKNYWKQTIQKRAEKSSQEKQKVHYF